jgi:DNA-binding NarL/FixJ family response regulator
MITKASAAQAGGQSQLSVVVTEQPIRIILADADTNFMNSLKDFLMAQPNYQVVARVQTCLDALIWCEELSPQIVVLDWHLMFDGLLASEMKGTAFLQKVKALKNAPAVIVASRLSLDDHRTAALTAGADEFMPKTKFPQLIRPLIRRLTPQF